MNKEEQVIMGVRDLFNKIVWLNKFKMEKALKSISLLKYIVSNTLEEM
ncbi:hypothetical protein H477_2393 [[Clostridium] sordellii ATCC 9714]|nr:hypothetical protein H477_2393 [[Clostridium] sordellii ATCC 9714] [Paeniclostridium sordellii ATCC 9714]